MYSADITFVILTKDEATDIAACLRSLPAGSRALVYDAQSADATTEIARSLGAQVMVAPWLGFAAAREHAATQVTTAWTFMIDADERITPELAAELQRLDPLPAVMAYSVARRNWFCGRWIRSAGWWPDRLIRLFRTGQARIAAAAVHETWTPTGVSAQLRAPLDHYSYEDVAEYRRKFSRYTTLEAQTQDCGLVGVVAAWLLMPLRAIWFLVRRGGVLDGWRGVYVSVASALYPAVVATKRWRRHRAVP